MSSPLTSLHVTAPSAQAAPAFSSPPSAVPPQGFSNSTLFLQDPVCATPAPAGSASFYSSTASYAHQHGHSPSNSTPDAEPMKNTPCCNNFNLVLVEVSCIKKQLKTMQACMHLLLNRENHTPGHTTPADEAAGSEHDDHAVPEGVVGDHQDHQANNPEGSNANLDPANFPPSQPSPPPQHQPSSTVGGADYVGLPGHGQVHVDSMQQPLHRPRPFLLPTPVWPPPTYSKSRQRSRHPRRRNRAQGLRRNQSRHKDPSAHHVEELLIDLN